MDRPVLKGASCADTDSQRPGHKTNNRYIRHKQVPALNEQVESLPALGLNDISPLWDSRLKEKLPAPFSRLWFKRYLELKRTSKCVVGEAHGFTSSYIQSCKHCDDLGWKFMFYFAIHSRRKLEINKKRFVEHWNEVHRFSGHVTSN